MCMGITTYNTENNTLCKCSYNQQKRTVNLQMSGPKLEAALHVYICT